MATRDHAAMLWAAAQMMLMLMFFSLFVFAQYSAAHSNAAAHCMASERIILLQFKATLNDTSKALSSWNKESNPNCCTWEGVSCDKDNNHVVALSLGELWFERNRSVAPSEVLATISKLHMLQSLDLSSNFEEDSISIPREVGALRNLLFLNLSWIGLSSKVIPMHIGNLSSLKTLDLSDTWHMFSPHFGEQLILPPEALLSLSNLEDLRLDSISMLNSDNWANSICKLHNIKTISMSNMGLIGPLPACLKNLTYLTYLALDDNDFSGRPAFPLSLLYLDLSRNLLKGRLPKSLCFLASLKYLSLHENEFNGTIPSCIGNLTKLNTVFLHNNEFEGSIPPSIYLLRRLTHLDLSSNFLNGNFSLSLLRNRAYLKRLTLSSNILTVTSNKSWSSFTQLERLSLNSCNMEGRFPSLATNFRSLRILELSGNHFVGGIPPWIWKFENLSVLDLSSNNFSGSIPSDIRSLKSLDILNLSKNRLYGLLPSDFPFVRSRIDLSHNLFNGSLPSFSTVSSGQWDLSISLKDNNISGTVPWVDLVKLNPMALDLSQNNLHGQLNPLENFSNNCNLRVLNLNSNHFSGAIPNLVNCSDLWIMDIGNNKMHGSVPKWIGKLKVLDILILRSNNFEGQLPQELLMLNVLQILDISSNKLSGFLPSGFKNLTSMASQGDSVDYVLGRICSVDDSPCYLVNATSEVKINNKGIYYEYSENVLALMRCIDVSNNQFTGEVPDEIGFLKGLIILNMSYNHFTGKIPKSLAQISQLDSLDLSNNFLSGEIPADLASLSMMGFLNLSHNHLTGKIPDEAHFETFPASSFGDNPGLCGLQINKSCPGGTMSISIGVKAVHSKDDLHYLLYWLACGLGFGFGFAIVMILLSFHAVRTGCFAVFDRIIYFTHFFILMVLARMKVLS